MGQLAGTLQSARRYSPLGLALEGRLSGIWVPPDGVVNDDDPLSTNILFQDLFALGIISRLDLFFVDKVILRAGPFREHKPANIETNQLFPASRIMDDHSAGVRKHVASLHTLLECRCSMGIVHLL